MNVQPLSAQAVLANATSNDAASKMSRTQAPPVIGVPQVAAVQASPAEAGLDNSTTFGQQSQQAKPDAKQVQDAAGKVNDFVSKVASELKFSVDDDTGTTVVRIIDTSTQEVIRQIPSQELLEIAKSLDKLQGLLVKQKV